MTTRYLVLPLELITINPQSRRASSASAYLQDFCCLSAEQPCSGHRDASSGSSSYCCCCCRCCCFCCPCYNRSSSCVSAEQLVVERCPAVSAVERVRGSVLRSESLGSSEPPHQTASATASSRHWFPHRASSFAGETLSPSPLTQLTTSRDCQPDEVVRDEQLPAETADDTGSSPLANQTAGSPQPSSAVRRNSVNRASSLSSATTPGTKSNFLAVPAPVIGAGVSRRASVIRARSLGNEDAPDTSYSFHTILL